jgi:NADP-reducing hydrogenase subunit HndB
MKRITSLAELRQIQQEQQKSQQTREHSIPKVIVGMGTCGIAAGAREILLALMDEIDTRNLKVNVSQTGCIGMCEQEPLLDVQLMDERVTYGRVTPELVKQIVAEHIINGRIVKDAALARLTRED